MAVSAGSLSEPQAPRPGSEPPACQWANTLHCPGPGGPCRGTQPLLVSGPGRSPADGPGHASSNVINRAGNCLDVVSVIMHWQARASGSGRHRHQARTLSHYAIDCCGPLARAGFCCCWLLSSDDGSGQTNEHVRKSKAVTNNSAAWPPYRIFRIYYFL